ncbi:MAG: response regulator [Deltaproteobacteria bacterium]|nr:MAG: response regulator [Deltaproteobacteria bacterium]
MSLEILILDDETIVGERLKASLEKDGHKLETFTSSVEALKSLKEKIFDIVVTDIRMDDVSGIEILEHVRKKSLRTKVIMITGYATLEVARESLTKGAFDFIAKPFKIKEIRKAIEKAAEALQTEDNR